ncbi:CCR4-Not complex 3'-5'-exoribonuclease subunit Ccr4-like [Protopterus annectens]|uniref:CCR4-Not complex 3'-5'-exoribonuclease subunit Ccr4-like n=1 Tax=Protopterus annectens TaxID=7888 RepID=UPI001CFA56FF|nr:CCR4-Not complex 3'-5'-exoribonuclease subunit Ccr4-like [Protopterus annectens]XP_043919411.1 CCR4-Not complex 3'-5'-exoribonuclease subunit Ccr4-like [Protopterus annectens]
MNQEKAPAECVHIQRKAVFVSAAAEEKVDARNCFTVVSYNILADCYIPSGCYPHVPVEKLKMTERHKQLITELKFLDGDIVCLQEVDPHYYKDILFPFMEKQGYQGVFLQKIFGMEEGIATFFKHGVFELVEQKDVVLNSLFRDLINQDHLKEDDKNMLENYFKKNSVLLITKLKYMKTGKQVIVGNIHTWFGDWKNLDIITIQIALATQELSRHKNGHDQSYMLCGDFNATPEMPGYQFIQRGYLDEEYSRKMQLTPKLDLSFGSTTLAEALKQFLTHGLSDAKSAYKEVLGAEPAFTNYETFVGKYDLFVYCLDYIWYSSKSISVLGVLKTVSEEQVKPLVALPNTVFPSDHVSVKAWFTFC